MANDERAAPLETADLPWLVSEGDCPKCGGDTNTQYYSPEQTSAGCDTYVRRCLECDWEADPE